MSKTILLVEDNVDDEELTVLAFEESGIDTVLTIVRDGAEALDFLFAEGAYAANAGKPLPGVVLLDLKLPKIDGLEVLRRLRADPRTKRLPVVVLTSSREEEDVLQSYERGANSYIRKPVDSAAFAKAIHQLKDYWIGFNEPPIYRVGS